MRALHALGKVAEEACTLPNTRDCMQAGARRDNSSGCRVYFDFILRLIKERHSG